MTPLHPIGHAVSRAKRMAEPRRIPDPRPGAVLAAPVIEMARQDEYLFAGRTVHLRLPCPGRKTLKRDLFAAGNGIERQPLHPRAAAGLPGPARSVDHHPSRLGWRHLPELDQDDAARRGTRRMMAARRIADIGAGRIVAVLVGEHAA